MAENPEPPAAEEAAAKTPSKGGRRRLLIWLGMALAVAAVSAALGYAIGDRVRSARADAPAEAPAEPAATAPKDQGSEELTYVDFDPVIVNLDEPRLARYIRATLSLGVRRTDQSAAEAVIRERMPELKNSLIIYLAGCSLDEVRGSNNLSRILREIQDSFNQRLWPEGRPLIAKVGYKEWAVQ